MRASAASRFRTMESRDTQSDSSPSQFAARACDGVLRESCLVCGGPRRGPSFYPRMLEDIAGASSSVHINQFGFRPGIVGDAFATRWSRRPPRGPCQARRRSAGSDPERGSQAFDERLTAGGVRGLRRARDEAPGSRRPPRARRRDTLEPRRARAYRSPQVRSRRRPHRLGRRRRNRGSLPGRSLPRPVRPCHRPVVAQLQLVFLASFRWLGGVFASPRSTPCSRLDEGRDPFRRSSSTTPPVGSGRSPTRSRACSSPPPRRSTSSTRTSPIAA